MIGGAMLLGMIAAILIPMLSAIGRKGEAASGQDGVLMGLFGVVFILFICVTFWISLAVTAKRWHDRGKSGWMVLISFIPVIGPIWTLIECGFLRGTQGRNSYGNDPT